MVKCHIICHNFMCMHATYKKHSYMYSCIGHDDDSIASTLAFFLVLQWLAT